MPNWCYNNLTVAGKSKEVDKFMEAVKSDEQVLDHNKIIPYPRLYQLLDKSMSYNKVKLSIEEEKELLALGLSSQLDLNSDAYNQGGYQWCIVNWGTKWGICSPEISSIKEFKNKNKRVTYVFDTAWSPPFPLLTKISELYPSLKFSYHCEETGMGFKIKSVLMGGKFIKYKELNI